MKGKGNAMATASARFVPKVHPATRPMEPEDPMMLHATAVWGDPEIMLRCLVEEYAGIGWDVEGILALCHDPFYPALHGLLGLYGEHGLRERVSGLLQGSRRFPLRATVHERAEPAEPNAELIQIGIRTHEHPATKGGRHAEGL
jgi:hypothetical protein